MVGLNIANAKMTFSEIEALVHERDKERIRVELKRFEVLYSEDNRRDLAYEITAFANRHGGRVLIGVTDDGSFQGKYTGHLESAKQHIDELCAKHISPPVKYDFELVADGTNEVIVLHVTKRDRIPHAYVAKRTGAEIKQRVYYLRTPNGKRLVTDTQLEWLFRHVGDQRIAYRFPLVVHLRNSDLAMTVSPQQPSAVMMNFLSVLDAIPEPKRQALGKDIGEVQRLVLELAPFAVLHQWSWLFSKAWRISIHRSKGMWEVQAETGDESSTEISVPDTIKCAPDGVLSSCGVDFREFFRRLPQRVICVPPGATLEMQHGPGSAVAIKLVHPAFRLSVRFSPRMALQGMHPFHPQAPALQDARTRLYCVDLGVQFTAEFTFPDENVDDFERYPAYLQTLQEIFRKEWDWDEFVSDQPSAILCSIDANVRHILKKLDQ